MNPQLKHQVVIRNHDWASAQDWCEQYIGEFDHAWYKLGIDPIEYVSEGRARSVWYFKNKNDATMFALRWS